MEQNVFRKKSLERVSSPEQLNQYICVSNPSVWLLLAAVIILLSATCVWGVTGHLETTLSVKTVVRNHEALCFLTEEQYTQLEDGMTIRIGNSSGVLLPLPSMPASYEDLFKSVDEYDLYAVGLTEGSWYYPVSSTLLLSDGIYDAKIVTDRVSPFSFLIN